MIAFLSACIWALLPAQKKRFDEAARLPLDEEDDGTKEKGR
ncbi:MAG: cbb3-type cytochrome c oxidase subunit 3 [Xanthomonadales bacterium]|nr:cbb3-type cytochrome c oxidase subunit 3 [Xanthomonadales bacterium]